jgi:hypothetical protein
LGVNKNKLLSFPDLEISPYASSYVIGKPLNIQKLLHFTGVDPLTGLYTFEDKNNDGIISTTFGPLDDRYHYDLSPKYSGGISNSISFKSFNVSFFLSFIKQLGRNAFNTDYFGTIRNVPPVAFNRWTKMSDAAQFAKFTTVGGETFQWFHAESDGIYTDASFIRLQNVSISYNLPQTFINKLKIRGAHIFLQGQNLAVITNYQGIDPETQNFGGMPPVKIFTSGIQLNL